MPEDRTYTAMMRQMRGMGQDRFEISVIGQFAKVWLPLTPIEIGARIVDLKRANKAGANILIRPERDRPNDLVFVDDIGLGTMQRMADNGHGLAVALQSSPGNWHGWLRVGTPLQPNIRHEIARWIATQYGADRGAIDPHKSGRLAGFTNRKPEHGRSGGFPFVLLTTFNGKPCRDSQVLIANAVNALEEQVEVVHEVILEGFDSDTILNYILERHRLGAKRNPTYDRSALDWAIVRLLLERGVPTDAVVLGLEYAAERKGKAAKSYAWRTVRSAQLAG